MTEYERDQKRAAGRRQREKVEELDRTKQDPKHRSHRKRRKAEIVEFQQSSLELGHVAGLHMRDLPHLLGHIRMDNARHQLHKQHDADDAKEIRNAVADRDRILILRGNGLLRRGERRRGGQCAGQEARHDGGELLGIIARCTALDQPPYENAEHCRKAAGEDDDKAQQNIGFEVLLHVLEEVRPGNKADGGNEEHKAEIFNDLQRLRRIVGLFDHELGVEMDAEEAAVDQRDHKYARRSEADALNGDSSENVAESRDRKDGQHQEAGCVYGKRH
ncbi:unknown [Firmicutes bacterium CAG:170]|nr:unknown [Firmicutes bacterium CAG:170]